eukprot:633702-Ditylum_brightwellii.AAC.1
MGKKPRSQNNNENKENDAKRRCCSGSFCTKASDPLLSDNKCPVYMMAVHPLCEVRSSPHQEHICRMCDAGTGEENWGEEKFSFSTTPPALDNFKDTTIVV